MRLTVADIGKTTVPRGKWLYTIRAGDDVLYVGRTLDPIKRLNEHFSPPGAIAWQGSLVTEVARASWDEAQQWRIELTPVTGDLATAEVELIRMLQPCLNMQHNTYSSKMPQRLRHALEESRRAADAARIAKIRQRRDVL